MIDKLLALQERDLRIRQLERELRDIPARKQAEESRLREHEASMAAVQQQIKETEAHIRGVELECQTGREKIGKLRGQQLELKTNKEFQAMQAEIDGVVVKIRAAEDTELSMMERIEGGKADLARQKKDLDAEASAVKADVIVLDERAAVLDAELQRFKAERERLARDVLPEWLRPYDRVFSRKTPAFVPLMEGVCGGCHMKLPPSVVHETRRLGHPIACEYCGRLLYWGGHDSRAV